MALFPIMGKLSKKLSKNLKKLRGEQTQVAFAKKLGISKSSLNRLEIGEQNVSLKTLEVLCSRLKCEIGELFK